MLPPAPRHNGGPPLDEEEDVNASWRAWHWRRAHKKAWKTPPREIELRRLARAEELGITYKRYPGQFYCGANKGGCRPPPGRSR